MKRIISVLLVIGCLLSLCACSGSVKRNTVYSADDLKDKQVGILSDTTTYHYLSDFENAGINVRSYSDEDIMLSDTAAGLIDCAVMDEARAAVSLENYSKLKALDPPAITEEYSIVTALESASMLEVLNSAVESLTLDGTIQSIIDSYTVGTEYVYTSPEDMEYSGSLTLGVNAIGKPYAYYGAMGNLTGMDIDIARALCDKMGVELNVRDAEGSDLVQFIRSGKADIAMGRLAATEANAELVYYSETYYTCSQVIIVRKK
ncbi:MAG: transporter substrate-binding domain-containing protein [Oscillospiraceae bacterium]|nr:transporter substrate-binding domain-containing protein [Oscillospiraceae bacterium]